jgi:hypothetical protein
VQLQSSKGWPQEKGGGKETLQEAIAEKKKT